MTDSTALATRPIATIPGAGEIQALMQMSEMLVKSGFLPSSIRNPQQAFAILTLGRELGIGAWTAINGIHVIQGKPTTSPQLMLALINRSGHLADIVIDSDDKQCAVTMKRAGRSPHTEVFTIEGARKQNLTSKTNWQTMPAIMLKWRAVAACARVVFPDVISGLYLHEEIAPDMTVNEDGEIVDGVFEDTPSSPPATTSSSAQNDGGDDKVIKSDFSPENQWPSLPYVKWLIERFIAAHPDEGLNPKDVVAFAGMQRLNDMSATGWGQFATASDAAHAIKDGYENTPQTPPAPESGAQRDDELPTPFKAGRTEQNGAEGEEWPTQEAVDSLIARFRTTHGDFDDKAVADFAGVLFVTDMSEGGWGQYESADAADAAMKNAFEEYMRRKTSEVTF